MNPSAAAPLAENVTDRGPGKRVAVMQPYLYPYAGYFRLFAAVDEFVIYDCVQFPRRGRVHRTEVPGPTGDLEWLTLPLAQQPRDVRIADLRFHPKARELMDQRLARLPWLATPHGPAADRVLAHLRAPLDDVAGYLEAGIRLVCDLLGLRPAISRSSELALDPALRGQQRVLAIAAARGAVTYINAPGGRSLYDEDVFGRSHIALRFLTPYDGPFRQLLPELVRGDPATIAADIDATTHLMHASPRPPGSVPGEYASELEDGVG